MEGEKIRSSSKSYGSTQHKNKTDVVVYIEHIVLPFETIRGLSVKYDVPIHHLRRANRLLMNDTLYENTRIYIPTKFNPATINVTEINGEALVVGDDHAPVKKNKLSRNSANSASLLDNSLTLADLPLDSADGGNPHFSDTMERQQSVHEIFEKIDQTVTAVKDNLTTLRKDGFYASHGSNSSEEIFGALVPKASVYAEDTSSNRSTDSRSPRNLSPGLKKADSQSRRKSGLSSTALQLANDHDNTDFPL